MTLKVTAAAVGLGGQRSGGAAWGSVRLSESVAVGRIGGHVQVLLVVRVLSEDLLVSVGRFIRHDAAEAQYRLAYDHWSPCVCYDEQALVPGADAVIGADDRQWQMMHLVGGT